MPGLRRLAGTSAIGLRRWRVVARVTVVVAATGWWLWPIVTADEVPSGGVVVVSDDFLDAHRRPVGDRVREDGRPVRWAPAPGWCAAGAALEELLASPAGDEADVVVLSFSDATGCRNGVRAEIDRAIDLATGQRRHVVIVRQPGRESSETSSSLDQLGGDGEVVVIDPTSLVGDGSTPSMPCEWWDGCTGTVLVRTADGSLAAAGADRVARIIVDRLP